MDYLSTRGGCPPAAFEAILFAAAAPDGGLYMPRHWPSVAVGSGASWDEAATATLHAFIGDALDRGALSALIAAAAARFRDSRVAPLRRLRSPHLDHLYLIELFHGPSLAFKDVALQILARLFDAFARPSSGRLTLIVATSGDTGAAVVEAFRDARDVDVFVLYPHRRVSPFQRRQMTTSGCDHIHAPAVKGDFDACQAIVKRLLRDPDLNKERLVSGANSINWARVTAQIAYYLLTASHFDRPVRFCVPTGNFGNAFAAYGARAMGAAVDRVIVACNRNDILHRLVTEGRHRVVPAVRTSSPSMDIQRAGNLERLLFELWDRDPQRVCAFFSQDDDVRLDAPTHRRLRALFESERADEACTRDAIRRVHERDGVVIDPHTATAIHAAEALAARQPEIRDIPTLIPATAHPAKFPDIAEATLGFAPEAPPAFADLDDKPERRRCIEADFEAVKAFIRAA